MRTTVDVRLIQTRVPEWLYRWLRAAAGGTAESMASYVRRALAGHAADHGARSPRRIPRRKARR